MVLNALRGVTGRSRVVMHCSDVDQYRPASLPDSLAAAQGVLFVARLMLFKSIF
jgi:hypothetical protein